MAKKKEFDDGEVETVETLDSFFEELDSEVEEEVDVDEVNGFDPDPPFETPDPEPEPEPDLEPEPVVEQSDTYSIKKVRGPNIQKDDTIYRNGVTYEVSKEVHDFLLALVGPHGERYFVTA